MSKKLNIPTSELIYYTIYPSSYINTLAITQELDTRLNKTFKSLITEPEKFLEEEKEKIKKRGEGLEKFCFNTNKTLDDSFLILSKNCNPALISYSMTWSESIVFMKIFKLLKDAHKSKRSIYIFEFLKTMILNMAYERTLDDIYDYIDIENRLAKYYSIYKSSIYDGHLFCFTKPTSNKDYFSIKRNLIVLKSILSELSFMETNSDVISVSSNINKSIICNYDKEILKKIYVLKH